MTCVISLLGSSGHIDAFNNFRREALQAAQNIPEFIVRFEES
jgi:hypothetical protein